MDLLRRAGCATIVVVALAVSLASARAEQVSEADVKAAFLFNFTRFVAWPDGTPAESHPFRLCVLADEHMTLLVTKTMAGEAVNGRPSETTVPRTIEEARQCQILFVARANLDRARPILAAVRDRPVLTVSDAGRFTSNGGTIQFTRDGDHVRFIVNLDAARRAGITISSRLLRVAASVEGAVK